MILTTSELVAALRNEVRVFLHLTTKIGQAQLHYRPTPRQRSTLELVRYMTFMGPEVMRAAATGTFDTDAWTAAEQAAGALTLDQAIALLKRQGDDYAGMVEAFTDADLRAEVAPLGSPVHAEPSSSTTSSVAAPRTACNSSSISRPADGKS